MYLRWLVVAGLLALPAHAEPGVVLYPSLGRPGSVTVRGRGLKEVPGGHSALSRNLRRLAASPWEGGKVEVAFQGLRATALTGGDGQFSATFTAAQGRAFPLGELNVEARLGGAVGRGQVQVVADTAPFLVVSDFDDTVAVSNVTQKSGLLRSALLEEGETLPVVEGMAPFYRCLREGKPTAPGFALVTGSPIQYVDRLGEFLGRNGFPYMGLYPRELSLGTLSNYKQPVIRKLIEVFPQKLVCVGDSGEKDPEVYAQVRAEAPARIARIYIRRVRAVEDEQRFKEMVSFVNPLDAALDAAAHGLLDRACVEAAQARGEFPPLISGKAEQPLDGGAP